MKNILLISSVMTLLVNFVLVSVMAQTPPATTKSATGQVALKIEGEVGKSLQLTTEDLRKMPVTEVKAKDKGDKERKFIGVPLGEILKAAQVTVGAQLRGKNLVKYVLVKAADGYEALFSLPELDSEFTTASVFLVFEADGKPLATGEGPYRLVVPGEKKHARWVREVTTIQVAFAK
ncbi:molybdopterin-dependent oxidoreductase [Xanthocytophaga agilis]|uniref:Molybdopterin-dependent oxidoreductase n=1 Tax=Xanthocytophaga agilis TaxID=3048010 RepID=A0AAE3UF91_9BACT|nr:molybdopterin-dependent oxidoreductase [Xanthocytophaga agilis]MDJ1503010.1 molybdopterin-dependent oxidoreductase [Xanthocytophaga agilis]